MILLCLPDDFISREIMSSSLHNALSGHMSNNEEASYLEYTTKKLASLLESCVSNRLKNYPTLTIRSNNVSIM